MAEGRNLWATDAGSSRFCDTAAPLWHWPRGRESGGRGALRSVTSASGARRCAVVTSDVVGLLVAEHDNGSPWQPLRILAMRQPIRHLDVVDENLADDSRLSDSATNSVRHETDHSVGEDEGDLDYGWNASLLVEEVFGIVLTMRGTPRDRYRRAIHLEERRRILEIPRPANGGLRPDQGRARLHPSLTEERCGSVFAGVLRLRWLCRSPRRHIVNVQRRVEQNGAIVAPQLRHFVAASSATGWLASASVHRR